MEKLYKKIKSGSRARYEEVGYTNIPDITDGIWLIKSDKLGKSYSNLVFKLGEIKNPVDVVTRCSLYSLQNEFMEYLNNIQDEHTDDFIQLRKNCSGYDFNPAIVGISMYDFSLAVLNFLGRNLEEGVKFELSDIMWNFRKEFKLHEDKDFDAKVSILYRFIEFIQKDYKILPKIKK